MVRIPWSCFCGSVDVVLSMSRLRKTKVTVHECLTFNYKYGNQMANIDGEGYKMKGMAMHENEI